jgi:hypothetical protein
VTVEGTQTILALALAAVLVSYASVIFRACGSIVRAAGMLFETKISTESHRHRVAEQHVPLSDGSHEKHVSCVLPQGEQQRPLLAEKCQLFASWWLTCTRCLIGNLTLFRREDPTLAHAGRAKCVQSNVTHVNWWRGPPSKPSRRSYEAIGLVIASTSAVLLSTTYWLMLVMNTSSPDRVITTGANETTTMQLPDGNVLSLGAHSTVKVEITDQYWAARLIEGEGLFNVARNSRSQFVVETFLARAAGAAGAKFRVAVDSSVEVEVYEGVVRVFRRGTKAEAPVITLQKGTLYRVPIDGDVWSVAMAVASERNSSDG